MSVHNSEVLHKSQCSNTLTAATEAGFLTIMETDELTSNIIDVTIAKYPHFDGFLCAATSVGTIICKQCKQGIGKAQWSNHLKSAHSDLLSVTGKLIGCTELDKTCSKLIGQCPSGAFENIHGKRHAHIAALGEPTVCYHSLECQEQLVPCFYAAATRNAVRFHLLQVHGIRFDSESRAPTPLSSARPSMT